MPKAVVDGKVVAESDETVVVEGNHYFPPSAIKPEFFKTSSTTTICPWKGTAEYNDLTVEGKDIKDAAWTYKEPKPAASNIKGYVAFYKSKGVKIED